jgi:DNA excision repair protein ERCC-4
LFGKHHYSYCKGNGLNPDIEIIVDDRERSEAIRQALDTIKCITVKIQRLAVGDFQVGGRFLFERKTLSDFAVSVIDGRLFKQMTQLAMSPLNGVLVLEGSSRDLKPSRVRREALQGALITTSLILGIPVLRAFNPDETARLMVYTARQVRFAATGGLPRSGYRPKGKRKQQLHILQSLPGVGPARAARLLARFGSVQNVLNASFENLISVEGIGSETARNIDWAVREPEAAYGSKTVKMFDL